MGESVELKQEGSHEYYMGEALFEANRALEYGEVPIGCVVVHKEQGIVARGHNWRETWKSPIAHAEMVAIEEASRRLGGWRLFECDIYVTLEPCPMCAGAIMLSRFSHLYFGARDPKGGAVVSKTEILVPGLWNHHPDILGGVLEYECGKILKDFFRNLRQKKASFDQRG